MGVRDWFRRRPAGQQEQRVVAEWGSSAIPGPTEAAVSSYASTVGELRSAESSLQKVAIWAAVDLIASVASWLPLDTYRRTSDRPVQIANGKLVEDPGGEGHGAPDWIYQYLASKLLRGNGYGRLLSPDPTTGYPTQVLLFHPDCVQGWRDTADGRVRWYVEGRSIDWPMWHKRSYSLPGVLLGMSPVRQHIVTIGQGMSAARFGLQYFHDGGVPGGLLRNTEVEIDPKQAKVAKARFMASMHGSREPLVMGKGWEYQQVQVAPEESQFLDTQKYTSAECARIFGPNVAEILGYETGGSMTYNNMVDRDMSFLKYTLNRWLRDVEAVLTQLLPKPQFVKFNRGALLEMDLLNRYRAYQLGISSKFLLPEEAREHEDLAPLTEAQKRELIDLDVKPPAQGGSDGDPKTARADDAGPKEQRASAPDDDDEDAGPLDEDCLALLAAMHELDDEGQAERAWDPAKHPRNPKGSPGGGRFRSMVDRLKDAIAGHLNGDGDGHPFDGFNREQLRKVAKARGIALKRGEDRDSIAKKLLDDLKGGSAGKPADSPARAKGPRSVLVQGRDRLKEMSRHYRDSPVEYEGRRRKSYDVGYDQELTRIAQAQRFDAKPQVATRAEMDSAVSAGWVETWRGVGLNDYGKTPAEINHDLRFGDFEPGRGLYGNGVYVSVRRNTAETFRGRDPKTNFPSGPGPDYGPEDYYGDEAPDSMLRIALDPAARIADYDELRLEVHAWRQRLPDGAPEGAALADIGRYAAARGYDGMIVRNHGDGAFYPGWETDEVDDEDAGSFPQADQYVIFNRSALLIQRPEDPP